MTFLRCIVFVSLFASCFFARAQEGLLQADFYHHLQQNSLINEESAFLDRLQNTCKDSSCTDSILLQKAICDLQLRDTTLLNADLARLSPRADFLKNDQHRSWVALCFASGHPGLTGSSLKDSLSEFDQEAKAYRSIMFREKNIPTETFRDGNVQAFNLVTRYNAVKKRSPFIAAMLSAVLPGAGKMYAGYKYQAYSAFMVNLFLAAQTVEAYTKSGPRSAHLALTGSVFGLYYLGNIAGSAWSVSKKRKDQLREIDFEIARYYSNLVSTYAKITESKIPSDTLLYREYLVWKCDSDNTCIINQVFEKSRTYSKKAAYDDAVRELERISTNVLRDSTFASTWNYEMLFNSYMGSDPTKAVSVLQRTDERSYVSIGKQREYLYIKWNLANEQEDWESLKVDMIAHCPAADTALRARIQQLPVTPKTTHPSKARILSRILPGAGSFYAGYPLKGITSLVVNGACVALASALFIHHLYVTGVVTGVLPFIKFYNGGARLSEHLTEVKNRQESLYLKRLYQGTIDILLPTNGTF